MRIPAISFSCMALAVFGLRMLQPSKTERFVAFITTHHLTTDSMSEPCGDALRLMLSDSALAKKWQLNGPLRKDGVNLYLVTWQRDDNTVAIPEEFLSYRGTLAYLGEDNVIAIDADYVSSLIIRLGLAPYIENPFARKRAEAQIQREFLLWVIGHELGHLVHRDGAPHFGRRMFEQLTDPRVHQQVELTADHFFAERLNRHPAEVDHIASVLFDVLDGEIVARSPKTDVAGPLIQFFDRNSLLVLANESHPEFVVRAMRIIELLQFPAGSNWALLKDWMGRVEQRIQPARPGLARLHLDSEPSGADVAVSSASRSLPIYTTPAEIVVDPGKYQVRVSARGFENSDRNISVAPSQLVDLRLKLKAAAPKQASSAPVNADQAFLERYYQADRRLLNARSFKDSEEPDAAGWELERALEAAPEWSDVLFLIAESKAELGQLQDAKSRFAAAIAARNRTSWFDIDYLQLSRLLKRRDEILMKQSPATPGEMAELAGIWAQLNRPEEAAHWLDEAREKAGFDCRYALALAKAFAAAARYSDSENAFEQVERCGQASGDVLVDMAGMEESRRDAGKAEADYRRAVELEPRSTRTLSTLAAFYAGSNRHTLASELYEKAAQISGDDYDYWDSAGDERRAAGEMAAAKRDYSRALSLYDSDDGALVGLGEVAIANHDWGAADSRCSLAARHTPIGAAVWSCLGEIYAARSDWDRARSAAERAVWEEPDNADYHDKLAAILKLAGDSSVAAFHASVGAELRGDAR